MAENIIVYYTTDIVVIEIYIKIFIERCYSAHTMAPFPNTMLM